MYYTVQIRLKTDAIDRKELLLYEATYHKTLTDVVKRMESLKLHHPFHFYEYDLMIPKASRWALYQIADKIAKAHKANKKAGYYRSATWAIADFQISNAYLILNFGESFLIQEKKYPLAMQDGQQQKLKQGKRVRLDLIHDEYDWFCNILMKANDESSCG